MRVGPALGIGFVLLGASAAAQEAKFPPEQIQKGAALYRLNCATCHGTRMRNPQWAIDLKTFPRNEPARFIDSVTYGKRNMPPWEDVLSRDDIEALWAYVVAGERDDRGEQ